MWFKNEKNVNAEKESAKQRAGAPGPRARRGALTKPARDDIMIKTLFH